MHCIKEYASEILRLHDISALRAWDLLAGHCRRFGRFRPHWLYCLTGGFSALRVLTGGFSALRVIGFQV